VFAKVVAAELVGIKDCVGSIPIWSTIMRLRRSESFDVLMVVLNRRFHYNGLSHDFGSKKKQ